MTDRSAGFLDRHYLLLRRLHSLSGVVPIGVFLFPHLLTNSSILWGRWLSPAHHGDAGVETFQHEVNFIHDLPALPILEMFGLWLPIAYHAATGVWFARTGRFNASAYGYAGNRRYVLQRLTGYFGIVFIFMHVTSTRFGLSFGGLMPAFDAGQAASSTAVHFQDGGWGRAGAAAFYLLGVWSLVFHFANGLWTAAITWGLTISAAAQRRWGWLCACIGAALGLAGVLAVIGFTSLDIPQARQIEAAMAAARGGAP